MENVIIIDNKNLNNPYNSKIHRIEIEMMLKEQKNSIITQQIIYHKKIGKSFVRFNGSVYIEHIFIST